MNKEDLRKELRDLRELLSIAEEAADGPWAIYCPDTGCMGMDYSEPASIRVSAGVNAAANNAYLICFNPEMVGKFLGARIKDIELQIING